MSPDENIVGSVLKSEGGSLGRRRLPLAPALDAPSSVVHSSGHDELRVRFSEELFQLEEEARLRGLEDARLHNEKELVELRRKLEAEFAAKAETLALEQQQKIQQQEQKLRALYDTMEQERQQLLETLEPVVGRLALSSVFQLLGRQAVNGGLVADIARQAIESYRLSPLRIRVSENDYRALMSGKDSEFKGLLQMDHDAAEGSCIIDFGQGQLDASLDTQLSALREILLGQEAHNVA